MERTNNHLRGCNTSTNLWGSGGGGSSSRMISTTNMMRELNHLQYHHHYCNHITTTTTTAGGASTNKMMSSSGSWDISKYEEDQYLNELSSWPPRSYTCSFCKREFRSAQALGGHMNVHRRDRARLRSVQSPTTTSPTTSNNNSTATLNLNLNNNPNHPVPYSNNPPADHRIHTGFSSSSTSIAPLAPLQPPPAASSFVSSTKQHQHQTSSPRCRKLPAAAFLDVSPTNYCLPSSNLNGPAAQQPLISTNNASLSGRKRGGGCYGKMKSCPRSSLGRDKCDPSSAAAAILTKKQSLARTLDLEMGVLIDAKEDLDLELRLGFN